MRVVQLLPEVNEGGVERGVVELNRELTKRGVDSWTISAGGRLARQLVTDGGHHVTFDLAGKNPFTVPSRTLGLRRILLRIQPDVIHARSRVPAWLACFANRRLDIPFVTTVHGFNSVNRYSRVMTTGERVICVSGAIRDYILKNYQVPAEKLVMIPRGVDLERFNPQHLDQAFIAEFRDRLNLHGKFIVTAVGRITQLKDLETFISALILIKQSVPNAVGLIVGGVRADKRDYFTKLQKQVTRLQADNFIRFAGSQDKVAEVYALSDVIVSSSKKPESFGRSAAEALAMNVPVAASAHGGITDIVLPGITGQLFPPENIEGLADAVLYCRKLNVSGLRQFISERFSLQQMAEATMAVYHTVADL